VIKVHTTQSENKLSDIERVNIDIAAVLLTTSVLVLKESFCSRGSSKTNLQVHVLVLGSQVFVQCPV